MNWILIGLLAIGTAQAGEFAKQVKDSPEESIFWTQRKASKQMAGVAAMVQGSEFEIKPSAIKRLIKAKKENIAVSVLLSGVKEKLLLVKQNPFTYETDSVHYAGIVKGDDESFVSLSIFEGKLTGSISTNGKKYTIDTEGVQVTVLDTSDLAAPEAKDVVLDGIKDEVSAELPNNPLRPIRVFNDVSYRQFVTMGSNKAAVTQYMQSVWASVSALFANDGITVQNSGIKVWDTQDPYSSLTETNSQNILYAYRSNRAMEPGSHLMHYTTVMPGMGGIAFLGGLCNANAYAVSSIYTTFQSGSVAYDWTQDVVTHEIGHNLSSPHTHACKWTMNGRADQVIDGCAAPESSTCSRPWTSPPTGFKGTIMSYCHLGGNKDLRLGFGEQPKNRIKNYIAQSSCLGGAGADASPPSVALTSLAANQTLMGLGARRFVSFTAHADDDVSVAKVEFFLKGPAGNLSNLTFVDYDYPFGVTLGVRDWLGTASLVGNYTMQAKATDTSGKTTLTPVTPFRIDYAPIDSVKPVVTIQTPPEGFNWTSGTYRFQFSATDNVGVTSMIAYYNNRLFANRSGNTIDWTLNYGDLGTGNVKLDVYAFDADGNQGYATRTFTQGVQPPPPPPPPAVFNIASSVVGQNKTVADTTKRNWIDLTLTGVVGTPTFAAKLTTNTSWSAKAPLALGNNVFRVYVNSANTNYDASATCGACSPASTKQVSFRTLP